MIANEKMNIRKNINIKGISSKVMGTLGVMGATRNTASAASKALSDFTAFSTRYERTGEPTGIVFSPGRSSGIIRISVHKTIRRQFEPIAESESTGCRIVV